MLIPEKIEGEKIYLQRIYADYDLAEKVFAEIEISREQLRPWLDWEKSTDSAEKFHNYLIFAQSQNEAESGWYFIIHRKNDDKIVGVISANEIIAKDRQAIIGYWLSTPYCKKGYMTEALAIFEKALFSAGIHKIVVQTDVLNTASAAIPERLGYHLEGVLRQHQFSPLQKRYRDLNSFGKICGGSGQSLPNYQNN